MNGATAVIDPDDEREDVAYDKRRQDEVDAEADALEAKRRAAGMSHEEWSIQDAYAEGTRCGAQGSAHGLNPFQTGTPEYDAWSRGWYAANSVRAARMVA